jgi:hypothetical protein
VTLLLVCKLHTRFSISIPCFLPSSKCHALISRADNKAGRLQGGVLLRGSYRCRGGRMKKKILCLQSCRSLLFTGQLFHVRPIAHQLSPRTHSIPVVGWSESTAAVVRQLRVSAAERHSHRTSRAHHMTAFSPVK